MGSAYRALDRVTGRVVALKQLDDPTPKFSALFEREYYTLASLRHPCVVEVYGFGITVASGYWGGCGIGNINALRRRAPHSWPPSP